MMGWKAVFAIFMCFKLANSYNDFGRNFDNLGAQIQKQVQDSLAPLNNLGQQIEENVHKGLEPVRALEVIQRMKNGIGGHTILQYQPNGKTFIIKDNVFYECQGEISSNTGVCSGQLQPFSVKTKDDYCYAQNRAIINNYVCLSTNGVSIYTNNGGINCESVDGSPVLLITNHDYKKLCQNLARQANYKYFANDNDPNHVQIPNPNQHVHCNNNQAGICEFSENYKFNYNSYYASVNSAHFY